MLLGKRGKEMGLKGKEFCPTVPLPVRPPWLLLQTSVDLEILNSHSRSRAGVDVCQIFCDGINDKYSDYLFIFTDGSKDPESGQAGSAFSVPKMGVKMQKRL